MKSASQYIWPVLQALVLVAILSAASVFAQSTDQSFPTPIRANEIVGTIKARDIGDSRLTSHFYTFEGTQGDLFINVQTSNFSGDIDVYVMPGLRPLTKMVMYADSTVSETGRVVYLRKPETILLRVEGRTPGDEEANYRIKFAGSFAASRAVDGAGPEVPKVESQQESNVRVNSVGTILEVIPKPTPAPKEIPAQAEDAQAADDKQAVEEKTVEAEEKSEAVDRAEAPPKNDVVITDPLADKPNAEMAKPETTAKRSRRRNSRARNRADRAVKKTEAAKDAEPPKKSDENREVVAEDSARRVDTDAEQPAAGPERSARKADPLEGVRLVIRFKDGSTIERPMPEVLRFTVEKAVLTVISKNGTVGRYQMIDIAGVTIE